MKTLQEYLSINEDGYGARDYKEASETVKEYIKELEEKLNDIIGIRNLKLNVSVKSQKIVIESDNLLSYLKEPLWKTLFGDIRFMTWGGNITQDGKVWFDLQISYEQAPNRGSDRRSIVSLGSISFDLNTKEWIFDK